MAKRITTIPATLNRFTATPVAALTKRRVAGYARVSTDLDEQQSSYAAQMDYYRNYITRRNDWEFVGMYSDEGITATNTRHRDGFNSMIADALAGKIDLIIVPGVVFDQHCHRIGRGGGYYDRFLSHQHHAKVIGVCYGFQLKKHDIPHGWHDIKVDRVVTPQQTIG